jgi:hypothetical protein
MAQAIFDLADGRVRFKYTCGLGRQRCVLQKDWFKIPEFASDEEGPGFSTARPLPMVASAAFVVESRMKFVGPNNLYRKSRGPA